MSKKLWYIFLLSITLLSCDSFVLKKEHKDKILKEEWDKLDQTQVEEPPLFEACKRKSGDELEVCFQNTITSHIRNYLTKHTLQVKEPINDTMLIPIVVTKKGNIILEDFNVPDVIESQISNLRNLLEQSINSLPEVKPAHTRGTPVTVRYKLPLVIQID